METSNENLSFGKRFGIEPIEVPFQINDMNDDLRIELWNAFYLHIYSLIENNNYPHYDRRDQYRTMHHIIWIHFLKKPFDDFPYNDNIFANIIRNYMETCDWYKVYELIEFILYQIEGRNLYDAPKFINYLNSKLKDNNSGYTLYQNKFTRLITETEVKEIENVQANAVQYNLSGLQKHLNTALELISKKPNPDYRNSIKESISMVEVMARIIEPTESTLGKALNRLDSKEKINPILKASFEKLYSYTNAASGIRHALMDDTKVYFEDAKFFLVSCSAFTNYLIEKARKDNIPLN